MNQHITHSLFQSALAARLISEKLEQSNECTPGDVKLLASSVSQLAMCCEKLAGVLCIYGEMAEVSRSLLDLPESKKLEFLIKHFHVLTSTASVLTKMKTPSLIADKMPIEYQKPFQEMIQQFYEQHRDGEKGAETNI